VEYCFAGAFADRTKWPKLPVQLLDSSKNIVGTGSIVQCQPYEAVCNEELDYDHVGVVVEDGSLGTCSLLRWPISKLQTLDGQRLALASSSSFEEDTSMFMTSEETGPHKRKYSSTVRVPKPKKPCLDKVDKDSIPHVALVECCGKHCCQHANRDAIYEARATFRQLSWSERVQTVYGILSQSIDLQEVDESRWGLVFDRQIVCPKAWYTIYGISRSTFFR
jgi:hypothetical protein